MGRTIQAEMAALGSKRLIAAVIMDVDGVILDSPHERAWREALVGLAAPESLTTAIYQTHVAGKPRLAGACAVLEQLDVPDLERHVEPYADRKQKLLSDLIADGSFSVFADAVRFILAVRSYGLRLAAASASKNANRMMAQIRVPSGQNLLDLFDINVCGRDVRRGKPDPDLFLLAASELNLPPQSCAVVEDAPAGILAAKAAGMAALGVARLDNQAALYSAGADRVVSTLDEMNMEALLRVLA